MKQGTQANYNGNNLQKYVFNRLLEKGYALVDKKKFNPARILEQPIFADQFPLCKGIYDNDVRCDFILYHPTKHPKCLVIECKWQEAAGSVDEKFPYVVANIKERYPCAAIILLDGGGCKPSAKDWLKKQEDKKLIHVFNMSEFQKWSNSEEL